jgi:hypothetical protein
MKTNALRFALFPLLALSALPLRPSACAQGTVSLPLGNVYQVQYCLEGVFTRIGLPVGNPSYVPGWGQLNIQVYYAPVGTALPLTTDYDALIPSAWTVAATTPLHEVGPQAGGTPPYTFTLPTATGGANVEVMVVGWTGAYADWNTAYTAGDSLLTWSGSFLSGGALEWINGTGNPNGSPPTDPVSLITGAAGYNGLVFLIPTSPEPSTFALAGLGGVMLIIFHRRK